MDILLIQGEVETVNDCGTVDVIIAGIVLIHKGVPCNLDHREKNVAFEERVH